MLENGAGESRKRKKSHKKNVLNFPPRVFELPLARNAQKRTKKKRKKKRSVRTFFFRAGADVRHFPVLFFLPPLSCDKTTSNKQQADISFHMPHAPRGGRKK
jgi:hypothetical protein